MSSQFRIDIKDVVEAASSLNVYPGSIPDKAKYPCIQMTLSGGSRDGDSNLSKSNIKNYRLSLIICAGLASTVYAVEDLLIAALDNSQLITEHTRTDIIRHDTSVELYNYAQDLYELTVDFTFKRIL